LENCPVILLDEQIETSAITLPRSGRFKLPDAIIAATAQIHKLTLLTLEPDHNL
jgi:predicted nucleic acid-binding protein